MVSEIVKYVKLNPGYLQHFWSSGNGFSIGVNEVKEYSEKNSIVKHALKNGILIPASKNDFEDSIEKEEKIVTKVQERQARLRAKRELDEKLNNKTKEKIDSQKDKILKSESKEEIEKKLEEPILEDSIEEVKK